MEKYKTLSQMKIGELFINKKHNLCVFNGHYKDNYYFVSFLASSFHFLAFKDNGQVYEMIKLGRNKND